MTSLAAGAIGSLAGLAGGFIGFEACRRFRPRQGRGTFIDGGGLGGGWVSQASPSPLVIALSWFERLTPTIGLPQEPPEMREHRRLSAMVLGAVLAACSACSYCDDRLRDAGDIFTFVGGFGGGAKARVGPFSAGLLVAADQLGWKGGSPVNPWNPPPADENLDLQLVLFGREESQRGFNHLEARPKGYLAPNVIVTLPTIGHGAEFPKDPSYLTQIEVVLGAGATLRVGFNPGELLDFIFGLFGLDLFGDDEKKPSTVGTSKPEGRNKEK